ncbi:MAG: DNA polymerase/3'-5' exonuclease PolX [Planctomycetota bacterium]
MADPTNPRLAAVFQQMADLTELTGGNRFKVNAFAKVARVLDHMNKDVAEIDPELLPKVDGIGQGTADRIAEYLDTGRIADHQRLLDEVPDGLLKVMDVPGLGPKTAALLWKEAGVESLDDLKTKLGSGELETLKGFGKKKVENIAKNLKFAESAGKRQRIGRAYALATLLVEDLRGLPGVERIEYAGSLRRGKETIGDIDILVACGDDTPKDAIFTAFVEHPAVEEAIAHGSTKASVRTKKEAGGMQADLRVVPPASFGAALMYFTGSKEHNVKMRERALSQNKSLNEYGLWQGKDAAADRDADATPLAGATEEDVFRGLGLAWVPPELREDRGELKLAEDDELPRLITLGDVRAELHSHTTASDGRWSIEDNARAAADRGFHTVAITDHSKGQAQANGLSDERLVKHIEAVRKVADKLKDTITVLAGSEVDILADGTLDYPDELLAELDLVVASPHAALSQDPAKATKRLLKAIENPHVHIVGHPTGRIINRRDGLSPDMEALFKAAAAHHVALEINASPYRLDLRDTHAAAFVHDHGGKLSINTDAHGPGDHDNLRFGVLTARRAGVSKHDVINCWTKAKLVKWLSSRG